MNLSWYPGVGSVLILRNCAIERRGLNKVVVGVLSTFRSVRQSTCVIFARRDV